MKYIDFQNVGYALIKDRILRQSLIDKFRNWLEEYAGEEYVEWYWERGNMTAAGVYIIDDETATLFRLRFNV